MSGDVDGKIAFLIGECLEDIVRELHRLGCRSRDTAYSWFPASTDIRVMSRGHHFELPSRETFTLRIDVEGAKRGIEIRKGEGVIKIKAVNPMTNQMIRECLRLDADTLEIDPSVENTLSDEDIAAVLLLREFRWDEMDYLDNPKPAAGPAP